MESAIAQAVIYPGTAVCKQNDRVYPAGSSYPATHIAATGATVRGIVTMLSNGNLTQNDWTKATGKTRLTPGQTYYLSSAGSGVLSDSGSQAVGTAVALDTLAVNVQSTLAVNVQSAVTQTASNSSQIAALNSQVASLQSQITTLASKIPSITFPEFPSGQNKDASSFQIGSVVSRHSSGTGFILADKSAIAKAGVGLSTAATAAGLSAIVQIGGVFALIDWTLITGSASLSALSYYYLSSAGQLSTVAPSVAGQISQQIGLAISPTQLLLDIEPAILL